MPSLPKHNQDELMEERANLISQAREIVDRAEEDNRVLSAEEREQYDRIMVAVHGLKERAEREFQISEEERALTVATRDAPKTEQRQSDLLYTVKSTGVDTFAAPEYREAFNRFLFSNDMTEIRALEGGVTSEGGALIPTPLADQIVGIAEQSMSIYGLATKVQTDSGNLDLPRVATSGTAHFGSNEEADLSGLSTDPAFGVYQLSANNRKASNYVTISNELLQDNKFDIASWIAQHGANAIAEQDETQYIAGVGTNGPTGFLSDANVGKTTSAAPSYGDLQSLKYSVRAGWRRNGTWVLNEETLAGILALETGSGVTLVFQPATVAGADDNLLGRPVRTSFAMANDAVGNKPIAFGDFSQYYIVEKPLSVARSEHIRFATDQTVFRMTRRRDGRLAQPGAVHVISRTS